MSSQLSIPHGINKKLKCETKNKMMSVILSFRRTSAEVLPPQTLSSSRMRVMNHNWSATKQHLHPQSVAEIIRHSLWSEERIRQCETLSGSHHKDTDQCL